MSGAGRANGTATDEVRELLEAGRHDAAAARAQELLAAGDDCELSLLLGRALHHLSRHGDALAAYEAAAAAPACRPRALAGKGLALCNSNRPSDALEVCDAALLQDAQCVEAWKNKAQALLRLGRVNEAQDAVGRALELAPEYPEAHVTMGLVRMLQMHAPEAEQHFRQALAVEPQNAAALANMGFMYRRMNRLEEAVFCLEEAVRLRPCDAVSWNNLGLARNDLGQSEAAEAALQQALVVAPENGGYRLNLAALYRGQGRLDEAIVMSREVLDREPDNLQALTNVTSLLLQAGESSAALDSAQDMVSRCPDAAVGHYNLAVVHLHLREPGEGEAAALRALELGMDAPAVHLALAQSRQIQGRYAEALEAAERAMALREDAKSHFSKAIALYRMGRTKEAAPHFIRSMELDPSDAQGASAFLAAIGGEGAGKGLSEAYLQRLFDQYAGTYDSHVTGCLDYRGPVLLGQALGRHIDASKEGRFLDMGCGTGLCGPVLRPWASELVGVDISENMLRKAATLQVYDRLERAEACAFLECEAPAYDCVVAGDVLVYIGDLSRFFAGVARLLPSGGLFAFTLEKQDEAGFALGQRSRFRHSREYVEGQAATHGFACLELREESVRSEEEMPVASWVGVLRRR